VNQFASQIAGLNEQIAQLEAGGTPANDLRDQRQLALEGLAELADVDAVEGPNGSLRVLLSGNLLVGTDSAQTVSTERDNMGELRVKIAGSTGYVPIHGGAIGGLLQQAESEIPALDARLDRLAHAMILEMNRIHSTGVPATGPFTSLVSDNRIVDVDRDGKFKDELVAASGLPFDVTSGRLVINITDLATGEFEREVIDITQSHTTVQDLLDSLNAVDGLSADVDSFGSLRIVSSAGVGFDFSGRLNGSPDTAGTFGGGGASVGTPLQGPFALTDGDSLDLTVDPGGLAVPISVTFSTSDFADISSATPEELAAAFNADAGVQANGLNAVVVDDRVFFQTLATGTAAGLRVDGGAASTALGLDPFLGTTITGHDDSIDVQVTGTYTGTGDAQFTFVPQADGVIGTTPGLVVDVYGDGGNLVASLAVGDTYVPGTPISVGEGISVSFGLGEISATNNDRFQLEAIDDPDTSDLLVALGLNSMFTGSSAADIDVRQDIQVDGNQLSVSFTGQSGDGSLLLDLLDVENASSAELGNVSIGNYYGSLVSDLGFDISTTNAAITANASLVDSLEVQRDAVRGVNVDEELVEMLKFEQAFAAASQFITVVNELENELLNLI
jgi:flagellar hook-associated protein FlgK